MLTQNQTKEGWSDRGVDMGARSGGREALLLAIKKAISCCGTARSVAAAQDDAPDTGKTFTMEPEGTYVTW